MDLKKIKKSKVGLVLAITVIFQIFILINLPAASSYIIHQTDDLVEEQIKEEKKINGLTLKEIFSLNLFSSVSAQDDPILYCCLETNIIDGVGGEICKDIIAGTESATEPNTCENPLPTKCDLVPDCIKGCCIVPEGLCSPRALQGSCVGGGIWKEEISCLIPECQKGCCVLGNNAEFTPEAHCERLSELQGLDKDFRDVQTESECLILVARQVEGACVFDTGECRRKTKLDCLNNGGTPSEGYLCSHPGLETGCEKQDYIICVDEKNEIYWFDSCGNKENIYEGGSGAAEDRSWNNGKILKKEDSCSLGDENDLFANQETCGNCMTPISRCFSSSEAGGKKVEDGDYVCKSLNCIENKKERLNGESWCIYDASIGEEESPFGKGQFASDTVGSEHWIASCINGVVEIHRYGEYRGEICTQTIIEEDSLTFSTASCVMNEGSFCLGYNPKIDEDMSEDEVEDEMEKMREACTDNVHCMVKSVDVADYFKFELCVPRYPKGADLTSGFDENLCSALFEDVRCIATEEYTSDGWVWIANEGCTKKEFLEQMNDLCVSIGDCGSYINYVGKGTDNINSKQSMEAGSAGLNTWEGYLNKKHGALDKVSWNSYTEYKSPVAGKYVKPKEIDNFLQSIYGYTDEEIALLPPDVRAAKIFLLAGGIKGASWMFMKSTSYIANRFATEFLAHVADLGVGLNAFASAITGMMIGYYVGGLIADALGISGEEAARAMMIAGGMAGFGLGWLISVGLSSSWSPIGGILIAAAIVLGLWVWATGWGVTRDTTIEFQCLPWQAPTFSSFQESESNCEKCNEDPLRRCTKYRCDALGKTCKLFNENTDFATCGSIEYEPNPPVISPEYIDPDSDYKFENEVSGESVRINSTRTDGCIQEFTPVQFVLSTNEPAECKYDFTGTSTNYENKEKNYPFLELSASTINHTFKFNMPSIDSLSVYDVSGDLIEMYGDMTMYVRCQDYWKNFNLNEYRVEFCVNSEPDGTAVLHSLTRTYPKNGAYLKYNTIEKDVKIWVNEPANCKYDVVADKSYDQMANEMTCKTELTDEELNGWPCSATLTELSAGENKFYIRCKDQPWISEPGYTGPRTEDDRNVNEDDYIYTLYVTENELKIDSIFPQGEIIGGFQPFSIDLEVETSGGVDNGKSTCYYEWVGHWIRFLDTFSNSHKQEGLNLMGGNFDIPIKCEDDAENNATGNAVFNLTIDSSPPTITRVYRSNSGIKLIVITDEAAECYYNNMNACNPFNFEDVARKMEFGLGMTHDVDWNLQKTYYIKCKDEWNNVNTDCAIIVRPSDLI